MQAMRKIFLVLTLLLWPALAFAQAPAAQVSATDRAEVAQIQAYLNNLLTLKCRFLQIAPNGAVSTGTAWLERPGKMRFQYDPPDQQLLVAGHGLFVYHNPATHQTTNLPLSSTPLGLLLKDHLTLSGEVTVTNVTNELGLIRVTLVRTKNPAAGSLTLIFSQHPLTLKQWIVRDAQDQETRVSLYNVEFGGQFSPKLFEFVDPRGFAHPRGG